MAALVGVHREAGVLDVEEVAVEGKRLHMVLMSLTDENEETLKARFMKALNAKIAAQGLPSSPAFSEVHTYRPLTGEKVRPETINKRIRDIRQLLGQAGHAIQPGPRRLASLDDLHRLAAAEGIVISSEIKTAC